jgi:murein tripeptide amidase MpaA
MKINAQFDSGNIAVVNTKSAENIELKIRKDSNAKFSQWFHFRLEGAKNQSCQFKIINAGECSYPEAWKNYQVCVSYDRKEWFRVPTQFDGKVLSFHHTPQFNCVYYAYFTPYSFEQHQDLLMQAQQSSLCELNDLGETLDGRPISLLTVGEPSSTKLKLWIIARQHAGETMAEWFMEGFLQRLLDNNDPVSKSLLKQAVFYIVPNMNVDGSVRGNLRANAAGIDLNRAWQNAEPHTCPEVYCVREKMLETGVDFFFDVHGDEEIPYNFLASSHLVPSFTEKLRQLDKLFSETLLQLSPDFQTEYGYTDEHFGEHTMTLANNYVCDKFNCLSFVLEMPFKDNANSPDEKHGWSPLRIKKLASACLDTIHVVAPKLR